MKFTWVKKGQIFDATSLNLDWAETSALTPTPIYLSKDIIRVYCGFRDAQGVSRIGFVDLNAHNPKEILSFSQQPCLDIGDDGCFDDNGVILGDVIKTEDSFKMYYVGFQIVKKAKFLAFSGFAESKDGAVFKRFQNYPILDRSSHANMINAIHTVRYDENKQTYLIWHAKGDGWQVIDGNAYPKYNIWVSSSVDGVRINSDSELCVDNINLEYRIGRPSVFKHEDIYIMFYTKGTISGKDYMSGIGISKDGIKWTRRDDLFTLQLSQNGWDSKHIAYPRALKKLNNVYYIFYNGNDMGKAGFGYAELMIER